VESARVEFKVSWDEETTAYQVLKTICAFANDFQNLNGGYIVIGVAEQAGVALRPPAGVSPEAIDGIQKWIRGHCNRLDPEYQPVMSPEMVDGKHILVVWAPGSDTRPHKAPDGKKGDRKYWVRFGAETVDAEKNGVLSQLLQLTARVPFDSRKALKASIEDLRESKVREFLKDIRSALLEETNTKELYRRLRIAARINAHDAPLNIGLLFFSEDPEQWFPGARIEVVQFAADTSGNILEERVFRGPLHEQIRDCLNYLRNLSTSHLEKMGSDIHVRGWVSYPIPALDETIVNAVYHRGYEGVTEPVKVYLYPDRMEIISYPGPVSGIAAADLRPGGSVPPVPARNRRIGELLKELRLAEGRGTGLPKVFRAMRENGSPEPRFDFDEQRTYFRATLPAHPAYAAISALRDAAHLRALGDRKGALNRVREAWDANPASEVLAKELIRLYEEEADFSQANEVRERFKSVCDAIDPRMRQ
jgi:ATP-dependent DNA helicase RecG